MNYIPGQTSFEHLREAEDLMSWLRFMLKSHLPAIVYGK